VIPCGRADVDAGGDPRYGRLAEFRRQRMGRRDGAGAGVERAGAKVPLEMPSVLEDAVEVVRRPKPTGTGCGCWLNTKKRPLTRSNAGAPGGIRTPNLLIRRPLKIIHLRPSPSRSRGTDRLDRPVASAGVHGHPALLLAKALARPGASMTSLEGLEPAPIPSGHRVSPGDWSVQR
jgi:hypothetical protein